MDHLRNLLRSSTRYLDRFISLERLVGITGQYLIFPFYHIVTDKAPAHVKYRYGIKSVKNFETDLDYLLRHFQPLDLNDLLTYCDGGEKLKKPSFFLTFDDGLREFHDVVAPILLRKGIPAACFVNSAFIDNKDLFYRYKISLLLNELQTMKPRDSSIKTQLKIQKQILQIDYANRHVLDKIAQDLGFDFNSYLEKNKPYLTSEQINNLIKDGFYFGAHSIDHPFYQKLSFEEQVFQTETSMKWVKNTCNQKYNLFSFPFSDVGVSQRFYQYFTAQNEKIDLSFGTAGLKYDPQPRHFQRISMEITGYSGESVIKSEYLYYILKSFVGKNAIGRYD